jgi:uncharacterized protein (DUF983 family)
MDTPPPPNQHALPTEPARSTTLLWRGARLKCPNCGSGPLFRQWVKMRGSCPSCHLLLDRGEADYFLGSYTINFVVSELLIVVGAALGIVLSWPDVPWRTLTWGLALMVAVAPILFYPFAKTLFLATDLIFRPLTEEDLE